MFRIFDTDGGGSISAEEFKKVMLKIDPSISIAKVQDMIDEADADGNQEIDLSEFLVMMSRKASSMENEDELIEAFRVFDIHGSGLITANEMKSVLQDIGENISIKEAQLMI